MRLAVAHCLAESFSHKPDEQNFSTACATIAMAQDMQKELARTAGAHLLHINAGLRELGSVS